MILKGQTDYINANYVNVSINKNIIKRTDYINANYVNVSINKNIIKRTDRLY